MAFSAIPPKIALLSLSLNGFIADKSSETSALHWAKAFLASDASMLAGNAMWWSLTISAPAKNVDFMPFTRNSGFHLPGKVGLSTLSFKALNSLVQAISSPFL